eukprot:15449388-Alexandrium_andersonii.AAC.1
MSGATPPSRGALGGTGLAAACASATPGTLSVDSPGGLQTRSPQPARTPPAARVPADAEWQVPGPGDSVVYLSFEMSSVGAQWAGRQPRSERRRKFARSDS